MRPRLARSIASTRRATRWYSAVPQLKPKLAPANETVNLLEAIAALVPQVFADNPRQLEGWNALLSSALADLRSPNPRPLRLVVCGSDAGAARDIVTALLEEPLASDAQQSRILRERWATASPEQTTLTIKYGTPATETSENSLRLRLPYLDRFPVPLEVFETADPALLRTADVALIVARADELHALHLTRPDSLVILNIDDYEGPPRASTSRSAAPAGKYLFVNPSQALNALKVLRDDPVSPETVQRYQAMFLASRMPTLMQALHSVLNSIEDTPSLRNRTALAQARSVLLVCRGALQDAKLELDRLAAGLSDLNALAEEERVKAQRDVLGQPDDETVDRALSDATSLMKTKLDLMTKWHRAMWNIDELTTHIATIVRRLWSTDLETKLVFHAGRLEHIQRTFTDRTFELLRPSNTGALHSPVLDNALRQLTAAPDFPVRPSTLIEPLNARNSMLIEHPTAKLHVCAQRAWFGMAGAVSTGMAISWGGYFEFFLNAHGMFGPLVPEPGTAVGLGIFISLAGVHWAARRWRKALDSWWADFLRVVGGLKQDIAETLDQTMEKQVLLVARTGSAGLSRRLGERRGELDNLQERLDSLVEAVERLEQRK